MTPLPRLMTALGVACAFPALAAAFAQDAKDVAPTPAAPTKSSKEFLAKAQDKPATKVEDKKATAEKKAAEKKDDAKPAAKKAEAKVEVRKGVRAVRVVAPAMRVAAGGQLDMDAMAMQFLPQFVPMMRTEVHLLLAITEATPEQRKAVVADRQKATKEAAKQYAQSQQRVGRWQGSSAYPEPRKLAQEALLAVAKAHLSAEMVAKYQAEIERRAEHTKDLAIKNIVAKMDQDLVLSDDQRDKVAASLNKNWNASWCQSLETFLYGEQYFPAIPDSVVVPHLNAKQTQVWRGTQRNGGMIFGGFNNVFGGMQVDDAFPQDEEPEEKDQEKLAKPGDLPADLAAPVRVVVDTIKVEAKEDTKEAKKAEEKNDDAKGTKKDAPKDTPKS